jgi:hypothetical protein
MLSTTIRVPSRSAAESWAPRGAVRSQGRAAGLDPRQTGGWPRPVSSRRAAQQAASVPTSTPSADSRGGPVGRFGGRLLPLVSREPPGHVPRTSATHPGNRRRLLVLIATKAAPAGWFPSALSHATEVPARRTACRPRLYLMGLCLVQCLISLPGTLRDDQASGCDMPRSRALERNPRSTLVGTYTPSFPGVMIAAKKAIEKIRSGGYDDAARRKYPWSANRGRHG